MGSAADVLPCPRRIAFLDTLRGFSLASMVLFHAMFDFAYVYGGDAAWFSGALQAVWRCSISWTFLALAGWMTSLSRDNRRRVLAYGAAAVVVAIATGVARVSAPISFGILYCMAACTATYLLVRPFIERRASLPLVAAFALLFVLALGIPGRTYPVEHLAWLGFPSRGFLSGDYYPLLPYVFLYLAAATASCIHARGGNRYPAWMRRDLCRPLSFLGRHSLAVYLLHQPALIASFELCLRLSGS